MIRAVWDSVVLAEAERTVTVEGNHYFPPESPHRAYVSAGSGRTLCPWKGIAHYHDVTVEGRTCRGLAWYYPRPTQLARRIKGHVAFSPAVRIERTGERAEAPAPGANGWLRSLLGGRG